MAIRNLSEKLVALCAKRGIIFPSAEIYGGVAGFYDYGPVGVTLKNRIREFWRSEFIIKRENIHEIETPIILPRIVWDASGHLEGFTDVLVECKKCHLQFRADHLIQDTLHLVTDGKSFEELTEILAKNEIKCPNCKGELASTQKFNLMFKTHVGAAKKSENEAFLRPETAQAMFLDFRRIQQSMRASLPFGIAQIGRSYRNEISPRNFLFRLREFEHLEIEFFVHPEKKNDVPEELWKKVQDLEVLVLSIPLQENEESPITLKVTELIDQAIFSCKWLLYWTLFSYDWLLRVGLDPKKLRIRQHMLKERAHYAADCWDIEFQYSFGWKELQGIADRTDYDLKKHSQLSKKDLNIHLTEENVKVVPHVIEPSFGLERIIQALLESTYTEETERTLFRFNSYIAPFQIAVFPLMSNRNELLEKAQEISTRLKEHNFLILYDAKSSIGRRYRRVDEIGVPFAVTIDFQTLEDNTVTIRNRDSMEQERYNIGELPEIFQRRLQFV
ncbi:MAG: glycine--tRNA ligase [Candidatus Helarchaeota archaeon]|nr:glycine--tRNA ligase [Candidatus Helarchaeota archaeon]